jgi:hypothetical protein
MTIVEKINTQLMQLIKLWAIKPKQMFTTKIDFLRLVLKEEPIRVFLVYLEIKIS